MINSSYKKDDVILLFKDITGLVTPQGNDEREKNIQGGGHYSEMLPIEYEPSKEYLDCYYRALKEHAKQTADAVAIVSNKILATKKNPVLVSLARAGTSIGILIKDYIKKKYHKDVVHYSISIIRDRGIDKNALDYILSKHDAKDIQFVDGWTGKGAIQNELNKALIDYPNIDNRLAVLGDPAYLTNLCGTHEDFLIASSCLNSTVCGLISRTFLRDDIIGPNDFHGVMVYQQYASQDHTYEFIDTIESYFDLNTDFDSAIEEMPKSIHEADEIATKFNISSINFVKPSIGETIRVLLRRIPWKILVYSLDDEENLGHIYQLAKEKSVEVVLYPLKHYKACGLIKDLDKNKRVVFAADLDNTLIHSYLHEKEGDICIEYKKDFKQGFMTKYAYDNMPEIINRYIFVPVTSRSIEQYLRIGYIKDLAKYAITSNGGRLLINKKEDEEWNNETNAIVNKYHEEYMKLESVYKDDVDLRIAKMIDESYYFLLVKDDVDPSQKLLDCQKITNLDAVLSRRKIYILPKEIDKGKSVLKVKEMLGADLLIVAGDNSFDLAMLNVADIAIVPNEKMKSRVNAPKILVNDTDLRFCDFVVKTLLDISSSLDKDY